MEDGDKYYYGWIYVGFCYFNEYPLLLHCDNKESYLCNAS